MSDLTAAILFLVPSTIAVVALIVFQYKKMIKEDKNR